MNKKELFFMRDFIEILEGSELEKVVGGYDDWEINLPEVNVTCAYPYHIYGGEGGACHECGEGTPIKIYDYWTDSHKVVGIIIKPKWTGSPNDYCTYHVIM